MTKLTWRSIGWQMWALHNADGKIVGRVTEHIRDYSAATNASQLGSYITEEAAKAAVEKSVVAMGRAR